MAALVLLAALALVLLLLSLPGWWSVIPPILAGGLILWAEPASPDLGLLLVCGMLGTALAGYVWRHCFFIIPL